MKELAAVLKSLSQLLGANDKSQARRNLRIVKKTYKFIKREFKKGGFSKEEEAKNADFTKTTTKPNQ